MARVIVYHIDKLYEMKLYSLTIKNFRSYREAVTVYFDNFTAFVGKNDIGKSTILEALDIFFNEGKGTVKMDSMDVNRDARANGDTEIEFIAEFNSLPDKVVLNSTYETILSEEKILTQEGRLRIIKRYPNGGKEKVFIHAYHPFNPTCADLYDKKPDELKKILDTQNIECNNRSISAVMRKAIWNKYASDLQMGMKEIEVTKGEVKTIWDKLRLYLPYYVLFRSDRSNSDGDKEVQDPLKEAVRQLMADPTIQQKCSEIADSVRQKLQDVSERTLTKLREMNAELANQLNPDIPSSDNLNWADVFKKVSITSDNDIPINKHGSGVKRLILLNFFRAEVERRLAESQASNGNIQIDAIYAIEEPETSQHAEHQRILINSFKDLAKQPHNQIIITTHSTTVVKQLTFDNIRLVKNNEDGARSVENIEQAQLPFPSLNEINYIAFGEISEEYHIELYTHIKETGRFNQYKQGKSTMRYWQLKQNGTLVEKQLILTEYIRNIIHHPENTHNQKYTREELAESIELMRQFLGL